MTFKHRDPGLGLGSHQLNASLSWEKAYLFCIATNSNSIVSDYVDQIDRALTLQRNLLDEEVAQLVLLLSDAI